MKTFLFILINIVYSPFSSNGREQDTITLVNGVKLIISGGKERYFFSLKEKIIDEVIHEKFKDKEEIDLSYVTGFCWVKLIIRNTSESEHFVLNASDAHIYGFYLFKRECK